MGKSKDGRVSLAFGDDTTGKVKVRFTDERQGRRVSAIMPYLQELFKQGVEVDQIMAVMQLDMDKSIEIVSKLGASMNNEQEHVE